MRSFFLTSKKASATLVFLVISILLVSSGVIIVHEVEKSNNENNIAETGLVLLDNEQNNLDALSDSSDDGTKLFTFGDSRGKTSPKKSSGGGGGSSNSDLQIYNEPEIPNDDETIDDQTSENQTATNYTGEINEGENETNSKDVTWEVKSKGELPSESNISDKQNLSSRELQSLLCWNCDNRNYESHEGPSGCDCDEYERCKIYGTKSTAYNYDVSPMQYATDYCYGETLREMYIDCWGEDAIYYTSKDCNDYNYYGSYENYCSGDNIRKHRKYYDYDCGNGACVYDWYTYTDDGFVENCNNRNYYGSWEYYCSSTQVKKHRRYYNYGCSGGSCYLVSNYYVSDTLVSKKGNGDYCSKRKQYDCTLCGHDDYDCDSDSECYGSLDCMGASVTCLVEECGCCNSDEEWNPDKNICEGRCECSSGPCCDGCYYKASGTQPTGYTDDTNGFCTGTEGATSTSYAYTRNYYCNGVDANEHHTDSLKDTCGTCEYCTNNDLTCNYYSSFTKCSSLQDCDYKNYYHITGIQGATSTSYCKYADYNDNYKYCNGAGSCPSLICPLGSDATTATAGTCKYIRGCSGSTPGTVKNYASGTSCGTNKECDGFGSCIITCTNECFSGQTRCSGNYKQTCGNYDADNCLEWPSSTSGNGNEYCAYGCSDGECIPPSACYNDSGCGDEGPVGNPWCSNDDVWQNNITYTCHYPGQTDAYCSNSTVPNLKEPCEEDSYSNNYCSNDDVYQNFTDRGCLDGACFENTTAQFVQECGAEGCLDGECVYVECYNDTMCDPDNDPNNNYVGDPWCSNDDVWQNYLTYTCNNQGTGNSYCSNSTAPKLREDCEEDYCEDWGSNYCNLDDVYHERTCHDKGCSSGVCFDNTYTEEEKVQECGTSEYTGDNYCYNDNVYRDYITRECSYSRCISSTSEKKTEDCAYRCTSGRCKIEICNYGMCYYV